LPLSDPQRKTPGAFQKIGTRSAAEGTKQFPEAAIRGKLEPMKTSTPILHAVLVGITSVFALAACAQNDSASPKEPGKKEPPTEAKQVPVGKNVTLEVQGDQRRVIIDAYVCLRQGQLEQLLTRKGLKAHEAILDAEIDAREVHTALNLAKAQEGSPVQFRPKFVPASGTTIKITLEYKEKDKTIRVPAQTWIRNIRTKKDLEHDWVFAGSRLIEDPLDRTKKPFYAANDGDVICVSNFDTAMLDLPVDSSKDNAELFFEAQTDRIPPVKTAVRVILEPVLPKKDRK
jgi:hypothetical protein